jgi:hypothetical protein
MEMTKRLSVIPERDNSTPGSVAFPSVGPNPELVLGVVVLAPMS